jgi:hypothetical protein
MDSTLSLPILAEFFDMTTKGTFLSLGAGDSYHEIAENFDFDALDEFVTVFITTYINRRGRNIVKEELSSDSLSETTTFLTRMIEVGSVQFLSENKLIGFNKKKNDDLAMVTALGINISMATVLQAEGVDELGANIFFSIDAVFGLVERVVDHIKNSIGDSTYIFSLVSYNLMGLINGNRIE